MSSTAINMTEQAPPLILEYNTHVQVLVADFWDGNRPKKIW